MQPCPVHADCGGKAGDCIYVVYIENVQRNQIGIDFETKIGYISIIIPLVLCAIGPGCLCIRVFLFLPFPIIQKENVLLKQTGKGIAPPGLHLYPAVNLLDTLLNKNNQHRR